MKKSFPLKDEKRHPDRVLDAIKHEIRKYIKREKKKKLPEPESMYWDFDCKVGKSPEDAAVVEFDALIKSIDAVKESGADAVYVEILARAEMKPPKAVAQENANSSESE
jgi:hypothetical protein